MLCAKNILMHNELGLNADIIGGKANSLVALGVVRLGSNLETLMDGIQPPVKDALRELYRNDPVVQYTIDMLPEDKLIEVRRGMVHGFRQGDGRTGRVRAGTVVKTVLGIDFS